MTSKRVRRDEVMDNTAYAEQRPTFRKALLEQKSLRRVHLGKYLTFLFENHATMHYQVQEMLRIEGTTADADIQHEIDTYNEVLGGAGDLGCTLLIEIDDPLRRDIMLRKWVGLPRHLYALRPDGERVRARFDERQIGTDRLSAVQYLIFGVGKEAPLALGIDMPDLEFEVALSEETRQALQADLDE